MSEEARYQELMQKHDYLEALPKIGETIWHVATWCDQWTALLGQQWVKQIPVRCVKLLLDIASLHVLGEYTWWGREVEKDLARPGRSFPELYLPNRRRAIPAAS
jgi:hypothetical protein